MAGVSVDPPTSAAYYRALQEQQDKALRAVRAQLEQNMYVDLYKYGLAAAFQQPVEVDYATDSVITPDGVRVTRIELENMCCRPETPPEPKPKEPEDPAAARFTKLELD